MTAGAEREDLVPVVDRDECMGFGYCTETLPAVFSLDDEGKSVVAAVLADREALDEAVDGCPRGAISLREALGRRTTASEVPSLAARVLTALEWAVFRSTSPELVLRLAQHRLLVPEGGVAFRQERWQVEGLSVDGGLVLSRAGERIVSRRSF